jgi:hypothetical protein
MSQGSRLSCSRHGCHEALILREAFLRTAERVFLVDQLDHLPARFEKAMRGVAALRAASDLKPDLIFECTHFRTQISDLLAYVVQMVVHAALERYREWRVQLIQCREPLRSQIRTEAYSGPAHVASE